MAAVTSYTGIYWFALLYTGIYWFASSLGIDNKYNSEGKLLPGTSLGVTVPINPFWKITKDIMCYHILY